MENVSEKAIVFGQRLVQAFEQGDGRKVMEIKKAIKKLPPEERFIAMKPINDMLDRIRLSKH